MNSDNQNTENALEEQLYQLLRSDDFHAIKTSLPSFNLFRTLGIADQELRHSNMLAWLFDPAASHGFGERFLRDFLAESCDGGATAKREYKLDFAFKTIKSVHVRRECPLKIPKSQTRPIDILIEMEFEHDNNDGAQKHIVAIENKVNSVQSEGQLSDYFEGVKGAYNGYEHHFIFLTKHDEKPEDPSFTPVNYKLVYDILTKLFDRHEIGDDQGLLIQHYMNLLKSDFMADNKLNETVQKLWSNSEYREVLELIASNQPSLASCIRDRIRKDDDYFPDPRRERNKYCAYFLPKETANKLHDKPWVACYYIKVKDGASTASIAWERFSRTDSERFKFEGYDEFSSTKTFTEFEVPDLDDSDVEKQADAIWKSVKEFLCGEGKKHEDALKKAYDNWLQQTPESDPHP